jgi:hypothetical protein
MPSSSCARWSCARQSARSPKVACPLPMVCSQKCGSGTDGLLRSPEKLAAKYYLLPSIAGFDSRTTDRMRPVAIHLRALRRTERPNVGGRKDFQSSARRNEIDGRVERGQQATASQGSPIQVFRLELTSTAVPQFEGSRKGRKLLQRTPATRFGPSGAKANCSPIDRPTDRPLTEDEDQDNRADRRRHLAALSLSRP